MEATGSQLEKIVRGWNKIDKAQEARRDEKRRCDIYFNDDGMCVVTAKLRPEEGAMLMKAIEAARSKGQNLADALVEVATRAINGSAESNAERYHVIVHTEAAHEETTVEGRLGDKIRVSAELAQRLTNRFADAHHVKHWIDGGLTNLKNLVLLCGYHHGFVHDGKALLGEDQIFRHKDGTPIDNTLPPVEPPLPWLIPRDMPLPDGRRINDYGYALSMLYTPR